jgi:porphobilinogen deaminase
VAALAKSGRGQVHLIAEVLSSDGKEKMRDEISFAAGKEEKAAELGREMLERAPKSIRTLFAAAA